MVASGWTQQMALFQAAGLTGLSTSLDSDLDLLHVCSFTQTEDTPAVPYRWLRKCHRRQPMTILLHHSLLLVGWHLWRWPMGTPVGSFSLKPGATEPIKVGHSSFNFLLFLLVFGPRLSSLCGSHFCHEFLFDKDWRGHRNNLKTLLESLSF